MPVSRRPFLDNLLGRCIIDDCRLLPAPSIDVAAGLGRIAGRGKQWRWGIEAQREGCLSKARIPDLSDSFRWNRPLPETAFDQNILSIGLALPSDYCLMMRQANGGEGFVGDEFVRLYRVDQLAEVNRACGVNEFVPGILVVGSNGGGEAFAFDLKDETAPLIKIPFIPMAREYAVPCAETVTDFLVQLAKQFCSRGDHKPNPDLFGKEIHEITPVVVGGDPVDAKNKLFLSLEEYAPFVLFWNKHWHKTRNQTAQ